MEHAVKNSLAKIRLHALNIRQGLTAGEYQRVEEYVDRLLVTTDQMLNATRSISRAGRSSLVVKGDWYDLQALVDQAIEPLTALLEMRVVREDRPYRLYLDPRLVTECLSNIFNNSLEALAGKGTVTVSLAETRRYAVLTIRDDGPGMPAWAVAHAFQPFYSTKNTAGDPDSGGNYGLGMAFVQAVMQAHRGRAELMSEPGEGTEVRLLFPKGNGMGEKGIDRGGWR
ncbi:MAG TPA: HAMP domain-containing sensor histidine kinase [Sphingobacteriaceae bacterium]|nr:HAMP domain-containing sensor histidine kinase [Sphingobacteriaceae bacterium]